MKVFIISGEKNHGKTRFLQDLVESLKDKNIYAGGFISPGVWKSEDTKDFEICNLSDNKCIHLASRNSYPGYIKMNESFYFNPAAIEFGNNTLEEALKSKSRVIIIDEIGPIELKKKVWYNSLLKLIKSQAPVIIISVRKGLTHDVIQKFDIKDPVITNISEMSPVKAAEMIWKELL